MTDSQRQAADAVTPDAGLIAQALLDSDTIASLLRQAAQYQTDLGRLRHQGTVDRAAISVRDDQSAVDREIISVMAAQGLADRQEIANLGEALGTARRIGAAVGVVMTMLKVTEEQAVEVLKTHSQNTQRKLRDVAEDLLVAGSI